MLGRVEHETRLTLEFRIHKLGLIPSKQNTTKVLNRLCGCTGRAASSLFT